MNTTVTRYDTAFYVQALDRFVATGECAETDTEPLYAYLLSVMNDSMVKVQVLGDEVCARIFYDTMIQFIQLNLEKERYHLRKSQSERTGMKLVLEWSMAKRKDGWQALLQQISDKYREYGFDSRFYRSHFGTEGGYADDEVWEKMVDDWEDAFQLKMHEEKEKEIAFRKDALERRLRSNLKDIPEYIRQNRVDKDEFFQTWGMMSGLWNTVDFERIRKIVRIQRSCPEIVKVARKMGRMADDEGREQIRVAEGNVYKMEHSSKCDILGISTGNDLNALLPIELAHSADSELEDLFVYKYLTRKLQTFRYKSEIMQPARARARGVDRLFVDARRNSHLTAAAQHGAVFVTRERHDPRPHCMQRAQHAADARFTRNHLPLAQCGCHYVRMAHRPQQARSCGRIR